MLPIDEIINGNLSAVIETEGCQNRDGKIRVISSLITIKGSSDEGLSTNIFVKSDVHTECFIWCGFKNDSDLTPLSAEFFTGGKRILFTVSDNGQVFKHDGNEADEPTTRFIRTVFHTCHGSALAASSYCK